MGTWIKRLGVLAIIVLVIGGLAYSLRETPTLVDTAPLANGPMTVTIREEGVTQVRNVYTISAPISGYLARTNLKTGDEFEARSTIAQIRPPEPPLIDTRTQAELKATKDAALNAVEIARFELTRAQTASDLAEENLERAIRLEAAGTISQRALQEARSQATLQAAQVNSAQALVQMRQSELASAEARLRPTNSLETQASSCCVDVVAPISGVVLAVYAVSEQPVAAGARIADVGDTNDLEVSVDLLSSDAVRIEPGARAIISDWGGDATLAAHVRRIEPAAFTKVSALGVEEQRVNAKIDLDETDRRLGHGYRVLVELVLWESPETLQVPISALFRSGRDWNVFVVDGDRARQVTVQVGHMNDRSAEVLDGLSIDDVVIIHPSDSLAADGLIARRDLEQAAEGA